MYCTPKKCSVIKMYSKRNGELEVMRRYILVCYFVRVRTSMHEGLPLVRTQSNPGLQLLVFGDPVTPSHYLPTILYVHYLQYAQSTSLPAQWAGERNAGEDRIRTRMRERDSFVDGQTGEGLPFMPLYSYYRTIGIVLHAR